MSQSHPREPIFNLPPLLLIIVALLVGLHLWLEYGLDGWDRLEFLWQFGFVPQNFYDFHISGDPKFNGMAQVILTYALLFLGEGWGELGLNWLRLVSYSLLHGDWTHLGLNLIWLVIFGAPLLRHLGAIRFALFWAMIAILSALTHFVFREHSSLPMIGASGVVSGLMAAAARFGFYHSGEHLLSMRAALMNKSILVFLGVWLAANLVIGFGTFSTGEQGNSIAWEAHIGGLVAGFILIGLFARKRKT